MATTRRRARPTTPDWCLDPMGRRRFLKSMSGAAALLAMPLAAWAQVPASRVVVVGGGFAGATAAKYLRLWSGGAVEVVARFFRGRAYRLICSSPAGEVTVDAPTRGDAPLVGARPGPLAPGRAGSR